MLADVTAIIPTRNRYHTTLPLTITAIAAQTVLPKNIIIYDDGDHVDLRQDQLYSYMFKQLEAKGVCWTVIFSNQVGQVKNHNASITDAKTEWIWRLDDDNVPEPDTLDLLLATADKHGGRIGAVAGCVPMPGPRHALPSFINGKISEIKGLPNMQWFRFEDIREVEHLYSTFIYRREAAAHGYCTELSVVGHREESIFTYEMFRNGWTLLVNPRAITWHYRWNDGGIRMDSNAINYSSDENIFNFKLNRWGVECDMYAFAVLDNGIGDHYAFKHVIPAFKEKYKNHRRILACCWPDVFHDVEGFEICSIADVAGVVNIEEKNIYAHMWKHGLSGNLVDAYKNMYTLQYEDHSITLLQAPENRS